MRNPRSMVRPGCAIVVDRVRTLRGSAKLRAALEAFRVDVRDGICLDVGAAAGGFTTVLLERGARRVYAVDAGHGQLLGSLRQDPRVVNLEATNVGELSGDVVPDVIDVITVDVSYLPLREAVAQLRPIDLASPARLIGLVKPMFELGLSSAPTDRTRLDEALDLAAKGIETAGWTVADRCESPVPGAKGARELFVLGVRP